MKVLGETITLHGDLLDLLEDNGFHNFRNQTRIICKCTGVRDANEKCKALGWFLTGNLFNKSYTIETFDRTELNLCEKSDVWLQIDRKRWLALGEKSVEYKPEIVMVE